MSADEIMIDTGLANEIAAGIDKLSKKSPKRKSGLNGSGHTYKEVKRALNLGKQHAEREEWAEAVKYLLVGWDAFPEDLNILTVLAHALVQLGVREHAIAVIERALKVHKPTPDLVDTLQRLALDMDYADIAVKLGEQLIKMAPEEAIYYTNLATAYAANHQLEKSINMLQAVLPHFPESADLWNVLATHVKARDGSAASYIFFEEALKYAPDNEKILSNYAQARLLAFDFDKAFELGKRACDINPEFPEPRIMVGQLHFLRGEMKEAWPYYESRHSGRRKSTQTQLYTHKLPRWEGQSLKGKTLLVAAEQGIGDEIIWGSYIPFLADQADKLLIGCDHRLVSIYKRRFPEAEVCAYTDRILSGYRYRVFPEIERAMAKSELIPDFYIPVASAPSYGWTDKNSIIPHPDGFLKADPERVKDMVARFRGIGDKPKVALAWRSGIMSPDRNHLYASIETLGPLFELRDQVNFINVQYGNVKTELELAKEMHSVTIHHFDDIDLKADIEANLAIMQACDAVVSSMSAPGVFSMSLGRPTMLMSSSPTWWSFGHGNKVPFAKDAEFFFDNDITNTDHPTDWHDIITRVANRVRERVLS